MLLLFPSFYAHVINGLLLLVALIMLYKNYANIRKLDPYKLIMLALIFSIGTGIHCLTHLGLEKVYGYNPMSILY